MGGDDGGTNDRLSRRAVLAGAGGAALAVGAGIAGWQLLGSDDEPTRPPTTELDAETSRTLAERFAPRLHFGVGEVWYPVDPSRYASERDGRRVASGFDAYAVDSGTAD